LRTFCAANAPPNLKYTGVSAISRFFPARNLSRVAPADLIKSSLTLFENAKTPSRGVLAALRCFPLKQGFLREAALPGKKLPSSGIRLVHRQGIKSPR